MVGLGYIGFPTACILAQAGHKVHGYDISERVVNAVNNKDTHIEEPGLETLHAAVASSGNMKASHKPCTSDIFIIAVPTPFKENFVPDLSYIQDAAKTIAGYLKPGDLVILESTSPVGSTEQLADWLNEFSSGLTFPHMEGDEADIQLAYCPERIIPGKSLEELKSNDRIIGGVTKKAARMACDMYQSFMEGECLLTDVRTAEMCKLAENTFRDVNIALANELSMICDKFKIDPWEMIRLSNHHPRVNILQPGPGVGGHCIAVDPYFLVSQAGDIAKLISAGRSVNEYKKDYVVEKIREKAESLKTKHIICYGLTFKPDIDDIRNSQCIYIIEELSKFGYNISVVEPNIDKLPASLLTGNVKLVPLNLNAEEVSLSVLLVKHSAFIGLSLPEQFSLKFV